MVRIKLLFSIIFVRVGFLAVTDEERTAVFSYLIRYGYLTRLESRSEIKFTEAIKRFQSFFELPVTGVISNDELEIMTKQRCGIPDYLTSRFGVSQAWTKKNLTYHIGAITPKLTEEQVGDTIRNALDIWGAAANLTFTRVSKKEDADIVIFFASGAHEGDTISFDGRGSTLGHAFYPPNGDLHFDMDENWILGKGRGMTDLFSVALHELGHSMGLAHSTVFDAVMYPTYRIGKQLHQDDINAINKLYKTS
uniref:Peptidase metallopeptidase domain-containing protein n=1 Tax=Photinus pyralis TaxID=7054 RepID=A0A1Y1MGY1_PHOPY